MTTETFKNLLAGYHAGTLTRKEKMELSALLHDPQYREQLEQLFTEDLADPDFNNVADPESLELIYQHIQLKKTPVPVRRLFPYRVRWVATAAAILLTLTTAWYLFFQPIQPDITQTGNTLTNDIAAPAHSRAVLVLADGKEIIVDSTANGQLAMQENINIIKTGEGQLMYATNGSIPAAASPLMNTLTIPAGSRPVQLSLTDGTKVWLNASSSITYPVAFTGNERKVSVTGEAYFEVEKGKIPFIVQKGDMDVQVLGTHFNVNAYDDEAELKVTLLEGKVKVTEHKTQQSKLLSPGEQAVLNQNSKLNTQNSVNLEQVMAWKEGVFDFSGADIQSVMRQLARWYNVQVDYTGKITTNHFSGIISRNNNISQVLKMLQSTGGVSFKIETGSPSGQKGKVIVLP
jgi:transmembrane sensor